MKKRGIEYESMIFGSIYYYFLGASWTSMSILWLYIQQQHIRFRDALCVTKVVAMVLRKLAKVLIMLSLFLFLHMGVPLCTYIHYWYVVL